MKFETVRIHFLSDVDVFFLEKNIVQTDFEGKNSCKETPGGKIPTLKKYLSWRIMLQKKNLRPL